MSQPVIFKGYIPTDGKRPITKYTDPANWLTRDVVEGGGSYAGLLSENAVLVDIDDDVQADILLNIVKSENIKCVVNRTNRGAHFFFIGHKLDGTKTHVKNALGLTTDYKMGSKNGIAILKLDGVEREEIYRTVDIEELPAWLYPVENAPDFMDMGEGGRNTSLYAYILALQGAGLTKEQSRTTITLINKHVFKQSLSASEIETILRDESFPEDSFYKGKTLLVRKFEEHFVQEANIIKIDNVLHFYDEGKYTSGEQRIRGKMLGYLPDLSKSQRDEILNRSMDRIAHSQERSEAHIIAFRNGNYNLKTGELLPHNPCDVMTNIIDWDYNEVAYNEVTDRTLDNLACNDPDIRALLEELIGYCFYRRNELGKAFILLGDTQNGKSTFLNMLHKLLGSDNVSRLSLEELNQQFKTEGLFNMLANIGDDISDNWLPDPSLFKKIATGDYITAEKKYQDAFKFKPYAKLIFSANTMPRIADRTGAVKRRLIPIPFRAVFSKDDPSYDPHIIDKLTTSDSMEYLVQIGIKGLERVLVDNEFSINDEIKKELKTIDELNNPILGFVEECGEIVDRTTSEIYDKYRDYCVENGLREPMAMNGFVRAINGQLGTVANRRMVGGVRYRFFEVE